MNEALRRDVLLALLKHYDAKALARIVRCPLCGHDLTQYTWTITNFNTHNGIGSNSIGLDGIRCSNEDCLLHNGIIYEEEGERLTIWQMKNKQKED